MGRSYPIWNKITSCIYATPKNFGARNTSVCRVYVGTSAKNSHFFVEHSVTRRDVEEGVQEFRFYVDGEVVKQAWLRKGDSELTWDRPIELGEAA